MVYSNYVRLPILGCQILFGVIGLRTAYSWRIALWCRLGRGDNLNFKSFQEEAAKLRFTGSEFYFFIGEYGDFFIVRGSVVN